MSALFFIFEKNVVNIKVKKDLIEESFKKIAHRGNQSLVSHYDNKWALLFKRLKTDSKQIQPYYCKINNLIIAIDGEIYNHATVPTWKNKSISILAGSLLLLAKI